MSHAKSKPFKLFYRLDQSGFDRVQRRTEAETTFLDLLRVCTLANPKSIPVREGRGINTSFISFDRRRLMISTSFFVSKTFLPTLISSSSASTPVTHEPQECKLFVNRFSRRLLFE